MNFSLSNCSCLCRRSCLATSRSFWIVSVFIPSLNAVPNKTNQMNFWKGFTGYVIQNQHPPSTLSTADCLSWTCKSDSCSFSAQFIWLYYWLYWWILSVLMQLCNSISIQYSSFFREKFWIKKARLVFIKGQADVLRERFKIGKYRDIYSIVLTSFFFF